MNSAEVLIKFVGDASQVTKTTNNLSSGFGKLTKSITIGNLAAKGISKGFQIMSQNMSGAISRVDTLNNFTKVMSNLGISAEESQEAIDTMAEKLKGLPTPINDAAMAVQRFTSGNNNVKKSTDIFLAVNNALLAGGASAEVQASALEQLSQAYAKGKPDAMEWRSMLTAMPAQLKQVASAMGYTSTAVGGDFYTAIQKGTVSMDEFMNAFIDLNKNGTAEFKSFEEQAKNATGGVGTSITNMKTAFVRGVGEIIKKIDGALQPFGGLSGVITTVGEAGEKAFKKVGDILAVVIPKLINFGKWIVKNKSWIVPLTGAILTFIAAFKGISFIITLVKSFQVAFALLNATMLANPIVLIVAAIAALIAGFVLLWNNCEGFRNFWIGLWDSVMSIVKGAIDFVVGIFEGIINFFKDNWQTILLFLLNPFAGAFKLLYDKFSGFRNMVNGVITKIKSGFTTAANAIKNAFNGVRDFISNIFHAIGNIVKTPINGIIKGMNKLIDKINSLQVPDWVPLVGGKHTNFKHIPMLKTGTNYVKAQGLAYLHEGEAVVPKKFNPYANGINQNTINNMNNMKPSITNITKVDVDIKQDNLGQIVKKIKTYSGGSPNDYNYGAGW